MTDKVDAKAVVPRQPLEIQEGVDEFTTELTNFLGSVGLPTEKVLVSVDERSRVFSNLPGVLELLPVRARENSVYISKFVAACGVGLFDAALNFLWDETIQSLREKVTRFDLEYFFSSVITDSRRRSKLSSASDLEKLADWELIRGCRSTGILSDIGYKHLDYIRDMRNWASAAHPNQYELSGLEVTSWLERCIREVIAKEPEGPVIEVRRLLHNIRTEQLDPDDMAPIAASIALLPLDLVTALLRTVFGMYTDPAIAASAKNNIKLLAQPVWDYAPEESRYEAGLKCATSAANADVARRDSAREFLELVAGLQYLPADALALEMEEMIQNLATAHSGSDNFHYEPPHARALLKLVPDTGAVPDAVRASYVKTVLMCRIGNAYGISFAACDFYDQMIALFQESEIGVAAILPADTEFASRLALGSTGQRYVDIIRRLRDRAVGARLQALLDQILDASPEQLPKLGRTSNFKREALAGEAEKIT